MLALLAAILSFFIHLKNCFRRTKAFGKKNNREKEIAAKLNEIDKQTRVLVCVGGR